MSKKCFDFTMKAKRWYFQSSWYSQAVVPKNKARGLRVKRKRIVKKFLRVPPVLEYNYKKFVPSLHASKGQLFWTFKGHI